MKTLFKLAAAVLLAWVATPPALAAPPPTAITIYSERGQPFSLALDGRLLTRPLARQVHLDWLAPGQHWADFSVPTAYGPPLRFRTSVWLQPGLATNYVLVLRPYGPQLRQVSAQALVGRGYGPYSPGGYYGQNPGGYGQAQPPQPGGYYSNSQPSAPYGNQGGYTDDGQYDARTNRPNTYPNGGQYGNGNINVPNQPNSSYPPASGNTYPNRGNNPYPGQGTNGSYPPDARGASVLSFEEATDLANTMRQQRSDDARLDMAKQTLDQSSIRSEELATLLQTLTTEDARVELAEFGYAHVTDPQNFSRVYSTFQSNTSIQEVQQAIGTQR